MTTTSPVITDFHYIEIAVGGLNRRNTIVDAETYPAPHGERECYRSVYLFTKEFDDYTAANLVPNRNDDGRHPSVSGYAGPVLARCLHYDIDATDPDVALTRARRIVRRLIYDFDVPPEAIRGYFSGSKGFHVEIPAPLFGSPDPGEDVPDRMERFAASLIEDLEITIDTSVYERLRLWREPNTINAKSGRFKVPLTVEELLTLTIGEITDIACAPREVEVTPDDEWLPRPALVALWEATDQPTPPSNFGTPPEPREAAAGQARAVAVTILAAAWAGVGDRHKAAFALAGGLARAGWQADPIRDLVADVAVRAMGQEGADRHASGEWARIAADTVAKVTKGKQVVGWPTLAEIIGDVAVAAVRQVLDLNRPTMKAHVILDGKHACCNGEDLSGATSAAAAAPRETFQQARDRRRLERYAVLLRRERELRKLIRDPGLSAGDKVHALHMRGVIEAWERKPSPTGEQRLFINRQAEACGLSRSTYAKRVDDLAAKTGAYRVRRRTLKVPAIDARTGRPIMNKQTGRPEVWRETQVLITPKAPSEGFIDAVLSRAHTPDPDAAKQKPKHRARGLACRKHPDATIIMETRILRFCSVCKEAVAPPLKREREFAPDTPAAGSVLQTHATPGQNLATPPPETHRKTYRDTVVNLATPESSGSVTAREWVERFRPAAPPGQNLATPPEGGGTFRVLPGPSRAYEGMKPPQELVDALQAAGGDA
jgi:hypothetical protein